jgi:hypothetical protein
MIDGSKCSDQLGAGEVKGRYAPKSVVEAQDFPHGPPPPLIPVEDMSEAEKLEHARKIREQCP